jgi:PqqD family protein of HPr-rel-A system
MLWHIESSGLVYDPGEETVIYFDTASGDTHLLTDLAAFVIEEIRKSPVSQDALVERIAPLLDGEDVDTSRLLEGVLEDLRLLDIARPQ